MPPNSRFAHRNSAGRTIARQQGLSTIACKKLSKALFLSRNACTRVGPELHRDKAIISRCCAAPSKERATRFHRKARIGPCRIPINTVARRRSDNDCPVQQLGPSDNRPRRPGQEREPAAARLTSGQRQNGAGQSQSAAGDQLRDPYRYGSRPWRRDGSRRHRRSSRPAGRISRGRRWHSWSGAGPSNRPCGRPVHRRSDRR